jgi:hypothetical protein
MFPRKFSYAKFIRFSRTRFVLFLFPHMCELLDQPHVPWFVNFMYQVKSTNHDGRNHVICSFICWFVFKQFDGIDMSQLKILFIDPYHYSPCLRFSLCLRSLLSIEIITLPVRDPIPLLERDICFIWTTTCCYGILWCKSRPNGCLSGARFLSSHSWAWPHAFGGHTHRILFPRRSIHMVTWRFTARIADPEKQPLLGNGCVNMQQYQSHR